LTDNFVVETKIAARNN